MIGTKKLGAASQSVAYRFGCKALAVVLAAALAAPMTGGLQVDRAYADDIATNTNTNTEQISVSGVDFMQPSADSTWWELLRVDKAEGRNLYIDIIEGDTPIAVKYRYTVPEEKDVVDGDNIAYMGKGNNKIAHIIELDMGQTLAKTFNRPGTAEGDAAIPVYTIKVYDAKKGSDPLYEAQIYPIYAKLTNPDDPDNDQFKFLGIRTAPAGAAEGTIGAGNIYYMNDVAYAADGVEPVAKLEGNALVIEYEMTSPDAIRGAVKYVDVDGNVVRTDSVIIPTPTEKDPTDYIDVNVERSFFASVPVRDENGNPVTENGETVTRVAYFRVIDRLTGTSVHLDKTMAAKQVRVVEVTDVTKANAYQVTIKYVDENDKLLWTDYVNVKGNGYKYTLPNIFSISGLNNIVDADGSVAALEENGRKSQWGVEQYTLTSVSTKLDSEAQKNDESTASVLAAEDAEATEPAPAVDPVLSFNPDNQGNRTITAKYKNNNNDGKVTLRIEEIDGETGITIAKVEEIVTPDKSYTYTPKAEYEVDGKKYVPWSGNVNPITYEWADLEKGTDLLQRVYYVSENYVPGDAYDVTVQYMNIANSQVVRTEQVSIDPEITDFVEINGPESFTGDDGNEYVRLAGQETAIRHAFLSPTRTYTIYYRDINDELSAQIVIRRTQIIDTNRIETIPGTTVTAAPVAGPDGTVDAGVGAGDGTAIINDDDNPLTTLDGQDTATERVIADNENPLSAGIEPGSELALDSGALLATSLGVGVLAALAIALLLIMRKRRKQEEEMQPAYVVATTNTDHTDEA